MDRDDLLREEQAKEEFMKAFDALSKSDSRFKDAMERDYAKHISSLALNLRARFTEYEC